MSEHWSYALLECTITKLFHQPLITSCPLYKTHIVTKPYATFPFIKTLKNKITLIIFDIKSAKLTELSCVIQMQN